MKRFMLLFVVAVVLMFGSLPTYAQYYDWVCEYDFLIDDHDWEIILGEHVPGSGIVYGDSYEPVLRGVRLRKFLPRTLQIQKIEIEYSFIRGNVSLQTHYLPATQFWQNSQSIVQGNGLLELYPNAIVDSYQFEFISSVDGHAGVATIKKVRLLGNGIDPCAPALPTPGGPTVTPSPTFTPTLTHTPVPPGVLLTRVPSGGKTCGYGLPCGPLPWALPQLPVLESPTAFPIVDLDQNPVSLPDWTATPNPFMQIDTTPISIAVATLQALMEGTSVVIYDAQGTPVSQNEVFEELGTNAGTFFGYARGIVEFNFGSLTPIFSFLILAFLVVLLVTIITYLIPVFGAFFGMFRKIAQVILDFIPF